MPFSLRMRARSLRSGGQDIVVTGWRERPAWGAGWDTRRTALVSATATGRAGTSTDIATTVAFLASPGARHITGQVLHVNGGAHGTR